MTLADKESLRIHTCGKEFPRDYDRETVERIWRSLREKYPNIFPPPKD